MITENKGSRLAFVIVSILCLIGIVVCLICDGVINKGLTWSLITLGGGLFGWVVGAPLLLAKKNKVVFSILAMTVAIIPLLYLVEWLSPIRGWFMGLAVPLAIVGMAAIWITFLTVKFLRGNIWFLLAINVFVYGVLVKFGTQYFLCQFLDDNMLGALFSLDMIIEVVSSTIITILLVVIGFYSRANKQQKQSLMAEKSKEINELLGETEIVEEAIQETEAIEETEKIEENKI